MRTNLAPELEVNPMSGLTRTDLATIDKVDLAAASLAGQGMYGVVTELSERFGVSRPTVYAAQQQGLEALVGQFDVDVRTHRLGSMTIDRSQLERACVALRAMAPNSIRAIEGLLPILYPGVALSYGKIQGILAEAEARAAVFNGKVDLSGARAGAVDEMFSQGEPVLAGVCLDTGFLFALELCETRAAKDWQRVLEAGKSQGLDLKVVVKDAAKGIEAGVRAAFPDAEQRDDCFHAQYEMTKLLRQLERKAFAAISGEMAAEKALKKMKASLSGGRKERCSLEGKLRHARKRCGRVLTLHDAFARLVDEARDALEIVDLETAQLRTPEEMERRLHAAATGMQALDDGKCRKVGRYLANRAPGLVLYARELRSALEVPVQAHGDEAVRLACLIERLRHDLGTRWQRWRRHDNRRHLLAACAMLRKLAGDAALPCLTAIRGLLAKRHRASSAIEGFNAALRPHLYVHKGASQPFLGLFRAYYNLRKRRWGRHKGTSAHECLTGERVDDWLTCLGYDRRPAAA